MPALAAPAPAPAAAAARLTPAHVPSSAVSRPRPAQALRALEVLKGVSLDAHDGDVISILGASGSGKSTLLRCINMLEVPDAGEVRIGGEPIALRRGRARPHGAGRPPQRTLRTSPSARGGAAHTKTKWEVVSV